MLRTFCKKWGKYGKKHDNFRKERTLFPEIDEDLEILEVTLDEAWKMIEEKQIVDAKSIMLITAFKAGLAGFWG